MPYQNIVKPVRREIDNADGLPVETTIDTNGLRITWAREGMLVQLVGCPMIAGYTPEGYMPEEEWLASDEAKWVSLGRYEINELIRTLRRARNAAFGTDE